MERLDPGPRPAGAPPVVAAVAMGYGHLRAAQAIADQLGVGVASVDRAPWCGAGEARLWRTTRLLYEGLSRAACLPLAGGLFERVLQRVTTIETDSVASPPAVAFLRRRVERGLGSTMVARLQRTGARLLTTFYAPAIAAHHAGLQAWCVVTDSDLHRVWVPAEPAGTSVSYLAPTREAAVRLGGYGLPETVIHRTGFPLPPDLAAPRPAAARHRARLTRLAAARTGGGPLHVVFAVGGAGAQVRRARAVLAGLAPQLAAGRVRLTLVAGTRLALARRFRRWLAALGDAAPAVDVLAEPGFEAYYRSFNALLAGADVLWTKPGELVFYAALGLPLLLDHPLGDHERANRHWATDVGAALAAPEPAAAAEELATLAAGGVLATAAEAGFDALPRDGADRIAGIVLAGT